MTTSGEHMHTRAAPSSMSLCENHLVDFWVGFEEPGSTVEAGITPLSESLEFDDHWFRRLLSGWFICVFGRSVGAGGSCCRAAAARTSFSRCILASLASRSRTRCRRRRMSDSMRGSGPPACPSSAFAMVPGALFRGLRGFRGGLQASRRPDLPLPAVLLVI